MTTRTYRFDLSGYLTVDDETLKRATIAGGIRQFPGDPVVSEDQQFHAKFQMSQVVDNQPLHQLLQRYLVTGFLAPHDEAMIASVLQDLPGATMKFNGIDVEVAPGES